MYDFLVKNLGQGLDSNKLGSELTDIIDKVEEYIFEGTDETGIEELDYQEDFNSYGSSPYSNDVYYSANVVVRHYSSKTLILLSSTGCVDEYGCKTDREIVEFRVYPFNKKVVDLIHKYQQRQKALQRKKAQEHEMYEKRRQDFEDERKRLRAEIKQINKRRHDTARDKLLSDGFKQQLSDKGNPVSKYKLSLYSLKGRLFKNDQDVIPYMLNEVNNLISTGVNQSFTDKLNNLKGKELFLFVGGQVLDVELTVLKTGEIRPVKTKTDERLIPVATLYANGISDKIGVEIRGLSRHNSVLNDLRDSGLPFYNFVMEYIKIKEERQRQARESLNNLFGDLSRYI